MPVTAPFQIRFADARFDSGEGASPARAPLSPLGQYAVETILETAEPVGARSGFRLFRSGSLLAGVAAARVGLADYRDEALTLYRSLFDAAEGLHLYRIWNYAPFINEGEGDDEGYRRFCEGRAIAFAERFGEDAIDAMPAGSCVGAESEQLIVAFVAGPAAPRHFENPRQVPAYRYPREYGPRSPSFARATVAEADGWRLGYISGTSAVSGHESVGIGNLDAQMRETRDNLELILRSSGIDPSAPAPRRAGGKVYLRHAADYAAARAFMEAAFPSFAANLIYLRSDICRRELLFEVELSTAEKIIK